MTTRGGKLEKETPRHSDSYPNSHRTADLSATNSKPVQTSPLRRSSRRNSDYENCPQRAAPLPIWRHGVAMKPTLKIIPLPTANRKDPNRSDLRKRERHTPLGQLGQRPHFAPMPPNHKSPCSVYSFRSWLHARGLGASSPVARADKVASARPAKSLRTTPFWFVASVPYSSLR